jgi:hypothetical protein
MYTSYIPIMHCKKMAVSDMSLHQCAVIEFLVNKGNAARVIYKWLHGAYGDICMGVSSG